MSKQGKCKDISILNKRQLQLTSLDSLLLPYILPPVNTSTCFEGDTINVSTISQGYKGDQILASTSSTGDELVMPKLISLEILGMRMSPRLVTRTHNQHACRILLIKLCTFGMLMASSVADSVADIKIVNSNFDKFLNYIHHIVLAAG